MSRLNKKQILIVDDEIFNIEAIKIILQHACHLDSTDEICVTAMNGVQALEAVISSVVKNHMKFCNY